MSHIDAGPLASYNSLMDPHLAGYFSNTRMRRQLVKSGLISRRGNIVSENTFRLNMARKEHKKHVRNLLAQAIVHKTLDMERTRQVAIKQKLEEIAKIEMVRRVRETRGRRGDEDLLPYLEPGKKKGSRPSSVPSGGSRRSSNGNRPISAPSKSQHKRSKSSENQRGRHSRSPSDDGRRSRNQDRSYSNSRSGSVDSGARARSARGGGGRARPGSSKWPKGEVDDRHLYSLNSQSLRDYTMAQYNMDSTRGPSPYVLPQLAPDMVPIPPQSGSPRSGRRSARRGGHPADNHRGSGSARLSNRSGDKDHSHSPEKGSLMLHRQEPAMKHQERVQTLCDVNMHYFGNTLSLDYERFDPRHQVMVEQQHCGGNTLIVFRELITPGSDFTFTSRRHRGYPFSLTFYVNGVLNCRLSTCCEYRHQSGARLGGKQGHFGMVGIEGAAPCYKCQVTGASKKKKRKPKRRDYSSDEEDVEVSVHEDEEKERDVHVRGVGDDSDRHLGKDDSIEVPVEEDEDYNYSQDDFDDKSSRTSSSYTSSDDDDVEWKIKVYTSDKLNSGTDANVYVILYGQTKHEDELQSDKIILDNSDNNFERANCDEFKRYIADFDKLKKIRIGHDNCGAASGWHLDKVVFENTSSRKLFTFYCNRWLADDEDDNALERELYPAGSKEAKKSKKVTWDIKVYTSKKQFAGTDANVYVYLMGELADGRERESDKLLIDNKKNNFETGKYDEFKMDADDFIKLTKLRIGHDNSGLGPAWHLDKVVAVNTSTGKSYTFHCGCWLSDSEGDKAIERILVPGSAKKSVPTTTWDVNIYTTKQRNSGTDANVYMVLMGKTDNGQKQQTDKHILDNRNNNFESGNCDTFKIDTIDFSDLTKLRIGHDNSGVGSGWHLRKVVLENLSSGKRYTFPCNRWLSDDKEDGAIERDLKPSDDTTQVTWDIKVYTSKTRFAGTDANVYVYLTGELADGREKESEKLFIDNKKNNFETGKCDEFKMEADDFVKLTKLRIGHDNSGLGPAWHLDKVVAVNSSTGKSYKFHCGRWFSDSEGDKAIERILVPGSAPPRQTSVSNATWDVTVYTTKVRNSGTDASVYIILMGKTEDGDRKQSDKHILDNAHNNFESGNCDNFKVDTIDFAELTTLRIGHDNRGLASGWHLDRVVLENRSSGKRYTFPCNRWLADNKEDGAIERVLKPVIDTNH